MDDELKELIEQAYANILNTASGILKNCKLFAIEILQQEDPSYADMAKQLEEISEMIDIVYDGHPDNAEAFRLAVKAREYTKNISNIAGAIRLGDKELLEEYIQELDRRPFL